jgi:putative ABC transport system ATP-binding protein/lipoprotein-releasing system ATP-binding protein
MSHVVLEAITKQYVIGDAPITAVGAVSLEIDRGEFVSIIGHSGSGKTTLLSIIGGIVKPTSGRVLFEGADIYALDSNALAAYRCERVGFMFQFASLLPMLTAKENLLLPVLFSSKRDGSAEDRERKACELLTMVGLSDRIDAYPSQLSGGQQRRVAIARAFMNDPAIILADEPTGDLDEATEGEMMHFFKKMNQQKGFTFIMVTHNTELAGTAGRRLSMGSGQLRSL